MVSYSRIRTVVLILLCMCVYAFIVLAARSVYENNKKMQHLQDVIADRERYLDRLKALDDNLKVRLEYLNTMYFGSSG